MARRVDTEGAVLVILDADDDLACDWVPKLLSWAEEARADRKCGVVLAEREWESWYLASLPTFDGHRGLSVSGPQAASLESVQDANGCLGARTK